MNILRRKHLAVKVEVGEGGKRLGTRDGWEVGLVILRQKGMVWTRVTRMMMTRAARAIRMMPIMMAAKA